jgi:hypothetical protein
VNRVRVNRESPNRDLPSSEGEIAEGVTVGNSRGELEELVTLQAWVERRSLWKRLLAEG